MSDLVSNALCQRKPRRPVLQVTLGRGGVGAQVQACTFKSSAGIVRPAGNCERIAAEPRGNTRRQYFDARSGRRPTIGRQSMRPSKWSASSAVMQACQFSRTSV
jgi:hypothetical protein